MVTSYFRSYCAAGQQQWCREKRWFKSDSPTLRILCKVFEVCVDVGARAHVQFFLSPSSQSSPLVRLAENNHTWGSPSTSGHHPWEEHDSWHFCGPVIAPSEVLWDSALLSRMKADCWVHWWKSLSFIFILSKKSYTCRITYTPWGDMNYSLWDARFVGHSAHFMHMLIKKDQMYKLWTDIWQNNNSSRTKKQSCSLFTFAAGCSKNTA